MYKFLDIFGLNSTPILKILIRNDFRLGYDTQT